MAKFTAYPNKTKPADSDTLLINDASASANKQILLSGLFAWLKDKFASSTISELETTDKTIVGAINELKEDLDNIEGGGGSGDGLTSEVKTALLQLAQKVAYIDDDGQDYYDDLYDALYPPADLVSISAVYTQSGTVYDTDTLDSLKSDLVVTALMSDSTTQTVTNYTLSGTLAEGISTITVTYGGKTATFSVTVTEFVDPRTLLYNWDFTSSLTDTVAGATATINANAEQTSNGLTLNSGGVAVLTRVYNSGTLKNRDYEFDISAMSKDFPSNDHGRFIMFGGNSATATGSGCGYIYKSSGSWQFYKSSWSGETTITSATAFVGKTLRMHVDNDGNYTMYLDDNLVATCPSAPGNTMAYLRLGDTVSTYYTVTFTAVRVYSTAEG